MYELKIGSLPGWGCAEDQEKLLGIVTSSDVTGPGPVGLPEPGCRIEVRAPNRAGILAELRGKIEDLGADIPTSSPPDRRSGNRTMVFQLVTTDPSSVMEGLKMAGYEISWVS